LVITNGETYDEKVHFCIPGIVAIMSGLPVAASVRPSGITTTNGAKFAAVQYAQAAACVQRCKAGCSKRYPGGGTGYDACMNKCQTIQCR
jgi:hypothetical protein